MHKRLVQATATAVLFATMALPALAHDGEKGRDSGFGLSMKIKNEVLRDIKKELKAESKKDKKEAKEEKRDRKDDDDEDENACLKAAQEAHVAAIDAANKERKPALEAARTTYHAALEAAQKVRKELQASALATFKASAKDEAAIDAFVSAYVKAHVDWQTAKKAAQTAYDTAKVTAEAKWKAAKIKADADFKAAKKACEEAPASTPAPDTVAPAAVGNLSLSMPTASSMLLNWTSTGDDGAVGTAASYDIRYSTVAITEANFAAATQVTGEPTPAVAGSAQTMTVTGLAAATTYHFAIKAADEASNVSPLSNVPSLATAAAPDTVAPAALSLSLSAATSSSVLLTWTSTGDDGAVGTAASYDIRYSTSPIATLADFAVATQVTGEPTPAVAGSAQTMTVSGLSANTAYHFAIRAQDEVPNVSPLSNVPTVTTLP